MALPPEVFKKLMMRDDLTCHSEAQVLSLVERYIHSKPQDQFDELKSLLVPVVRLDKLPSDRLIQLSKGAVGILQGCEQEVTDALCRRLKAFDCQTGETFLMIKDRNYYG